MKSYSRILILASLTIALSLSPTSPASSSGLNQNGTECKMTFSLDTWSAFYRSSRGEGVITCDDGQSLEVVLRAKGAGLTVGKSRIVDGKGRFSKLVDIEDALGTYGAAGAHAGAVGSAEALALTKGPVSLALAGTGQGFDLGVAISRFKIKRKR